MTDLNQYLPTPDEGYEIKIISGARQRLAGKWKLTLNIEQVPVDPFEGCSIIDSITLPKDATEDIKRQVEAQLAHNNGISDSLPDGHPYKYNPPTLAICYKCNKPITNKPQSCSACKGMCEVKDGE